jgi:hypothetical protein
MTRRTLVLAGLLLATLAVVAVFVLGGGFSASADCEEKPPPNQFAVAECDAAGNPIPPK